MIRALLLSLLLHSMLWALLHWQRLSHLKIAAVKASVLSPRSISITEVDVFTVKQPMASKGGGELENAIRPSQQIRSVKSTQAVKPIQAAKPNQPVNSIIPVSPSTSETKPSVDGELSKRGTEVFDFSSQPTPKYPQESLARSEEGVVYLQVATDQDGQIISIDVSKSSGSETLDNEAIATIKRWQLPANVTLRVPFAFELRTTKNQAPYN